MKNITLTFLLISQAGMLAAQIPNSGFEFWNSATIGSTTVNNPTGWGTQNFNNVFDAKPESATITTTAYEGNKALVLTNNAGTPAYARTEQFTGSGFDLKFPLGYKYLNLELYYQYDSPGLDSFMVEVNVYKMGTKIGSGKLINGDKKSTYTRLVVPLQYTQSGIPDSASLSIVAGKTTPYISGSVLTIDALNFIDLSTGIDDNLPASGQTTRVYPNPASGEIAFMGEKNKVYDITLTDINGKTVERFALSVENKWLIPAFLTNGLYFIRIKEGDQEEYHRLLINR